MKSTDFPFPVRAEDRNRGSEQIDPSQDSVSSPCQGEDEGEGPITAQRVKIPLCLPSPATPGRAYGFVFSVGSS
jgi:hypothetical protein